MSDNRPQDTETNTRNARDLARVSALLEPVENRDDAPSLSQQMALSQANDMLALAQATLRAAYDHLSEAPDDVSDAQAAVNLATQTVRDLRSGRVGAAGAAALVNTLARAVTNAADEVVAHEGGAAETTAKRSAVQAEVADARRHGSALAAAEKANEMRAATARRMAAAQRAIEERLHPRIQSGPAAELDGDAEDRREAVNARRRAESTRRLQRYSRSDDGGPDAFRTVTGASRVTARVSVAVRRSTYDAAADVGMIGAPTLNTAQNLVTGEVNARTDGERTYYQDQQSRAIARRTGWTTFYEQEIDNALPSLQNTSVGRAIVNSDNTFSSSLYNSSVLARLRANGWVVGDKAGMGTWNADANSQWSDRNRQRLDGCITGRQDGQLSAAEIEFGLTHRYGARPAIPAPSAAAGHTYNDDIRRLAGVINGNNWKITFDRAGDGRVDYNDVVATLRDAGITNLRQIDLNGDGVISGQELATVAQQHGLHAGRRPNR